MKYWALKQILAGLFIAATLWAPAAPAQAATARIKDIVSIEGVRDNQLVGYGLVIGLAGSGDSLRNSPFTEQSIRAMLENLGIATEGGSARACSSTAMPRSCVRRTF